MSERGVPGLGAGAEVRRLRVSRPSCGTRRDRERNLTRHYCSRRDLI